MARRVSSPLHPLLLTLLVLAGAAPGRPALAQDQDAAEPTAAQRGAALFAQGRCGEALAPLDAALAEGPRHGNLLYMAARCQADTGKNRVVVLRTVTEALPLLQTAASAAGAGLDEHAFLADAYRLAGNDPSARQAAVEGVAAFNAGGLGGMEGMDAVALQRLGEMAILAEDWDLAGKALDAAVARSSAAGEEGELLAARALSTLGSGQLAAGDAKAAIASLQQSVALDGDDSRARLQLARALYLDGQYLPAADQWREIRMIDVARANQATYAAMVLHTLAQEDRLKKPETTLPDLSAATPADLENRMIELAGALNAAAAGLSPDLVKRGYADATTDDAAKEQLQEFRDLKLQLAWAAAAYVDRGLELRDFAFARGIQGYLRNWRLPKDPREERDKSGAPVWLDELSDQQRQEYEAQQEARRKLRQERKKQKKQKDGD